MHIIDILSNHKKASWFELTSCMTQTNYQGPVVQNTVRVMKLLGKDSLSLTVLIKLNWSNTFC